LAKTEWRFYTKLRKVRKQLLYVRSAVAFVSVDLRLDLRSSNSRTNARKSVFCIVVSPIYWKATRLPEP
jgi:hypothetical protein